MRGMGEASFEGGKLGWSNKKYFGGNKEAMIAQSFQNSCP